MKPANSDGRQARTIAVEHAGIAHPKIESEHHGLHYQPDRQSEGRGHDIAGQPQTQDRTAVAYRRQREHRTGCEPEQRRPDVDGGTGFERHDQHAGGGDHDGRRHRRRHGVSKKDRAEQRDLHRLGLDVGIDHYERAVVHGGEHQRRGGNLCQGAVDDPGPERERRARQALREGDHHPGEENERERRSEQEPHMGRAHCAEPGRELVLRGIAHGLGGSRNDREHRPQPPGFGHSPAPLPPNAAPASLKGRRPARAIRNTRASTPHANAT